MMRRIFAIAFIFSYYSSFSQQEVSLEQVIELALEQSYDVKLARNSEEVGSTDDQYAIGAFLPRINGTASTVWNSNDQSLRFEDANRNNSGKAESNNISASANLQWTLFDGTRMFATRERIAAIASQGELLVKDQMVNTIATVATNYFDIVRQKQQLRAIEEQMAVSEERVKLADRKLAVGTGAKPELLQAKVDYNAQRTQMLQQQALIAQLKDMLNAQLGLQLPRSFDVSDTIIIDLSIVKTDIESNIENTNYALQVRRNEIGISNLSLRERRGELLPFLDFNASYNYSKTDNTRLINPFSPIFNQSNGYNYGFTLSVPVLNGFNQRRLVQQARINVQRQQILYDQQRTNVSVGIENAFINYDNAKKILLVEEENIALAKENVSIALETFKRGATTFVELRTAQQSLADAYTRLISARYLAKVAEIELLRLNGSLLK